MHNSLLDPPDDYEPQECCNKEMDLNSIDGSLKCFICGKYIPPEIDPDQEVFDFWENNFDVGDDSTYDERPHW